MQAFPPAILFSRAADRDVSKFWPMQKLTINPLRQVAMTRDPELDRGPFNRQRYSIPALEQPLARQAMRAAGGQGVDPGDQLIPVINLCSVWAGRRGTVVYDPNPSNMTKPRLARPVE